MDEKAFLRFLKQNGKSTRSMQTILACARRYEVFLKARGKEFATALPADLHAFAADKTAGGYAAQGESVPFLAISDIYEWLDSDSPVRWEAHILFSAASFSDFKLSQYLGVDPNHVAALRLAGIVSAPQMLAAGADPPGREALARVTGIPPDCILELVKLSDLARIGGVKRIRARLYYAGGFDTLDKLAAATSFEIRAKLDAFIQRTKFPGVIPTPKEANHAVHVARQLTRVVKY